VRTAVIAFAASALLTGCATAQLNRGLQGLMGQKIQAAVARMGYPDGQREMMGDTIYVWSTNHQAIMPLMTNSTTTGLVGGTPVYGSTNSMNFVPVAAQCTVQIATTPDGTIKSYEWAGNQIGCRRYSSEF